jgi:hypothetical protein
MKTALLVQVGQGATHVCGEVRRIEKKLGIDSARIDVTAFNSHLHYPADTIGYSKSANDDVEVILEQIQKSMEEIDIPNGISLAVDLSTSSAVLNPLLEEINYAFGRLRFDAYVVNLGNMSGLETLNAVRNMQGLLYACDSVLLRDISDARRFLEQEHIADYDIRMIGNVIASDYVVALNCKNNCAHFSNMLFPRDVCSSRSKLYDLRTSLWKWMNIHASANKYSSIRAVANNIHAVHSVHQSAHHSAYHPQNVVLDPLDDVVASSSLIDLQLNKPDKALYSKPCTCTTTDVETALRWASPGLKWPSMGVRRARDAASGLVSTESGFACADTDCHSISSLARTDFPVPTQKSSSARTMEPNISAVALISPYSNRDIKSLYIKALTLLNAGAYVRRSVPVGELVFI